MISITHVLSTVPVLVRPGTGARRLAAVLIGLLIASCTPGLFKDDHIEVGTVLARNVLALTARDTLRLVGADADAIAFFSDQVAETVVITDGHVTLSDTAAAALQETYDDLEYRVTVRLCIRRTTEEYRLDREAFNLLRIGVIAKFRLNPEETAIDSLIAY